MTMSGIFSNPTTPPIGQGSYAAWVVFVVVIILSVALGTLISKAVFK